MNTSCNCADCKEIRENVSDSEADGGNNSNQSFVTCDEFSIDMQSMNERHSFVVDDGDKPITLFVMRLQQHLRRWWWCIPLLLVLISLIYIIFKQLFLNESTIGNNNHHSTTTTKPDLLTSLNLKNS